MDLSFDEKTYKEYLEEEEIAPNAKIREEHETFFDALLSDDADLRTTPEGREIIKNIQSFESNQ